MNAGVVAAIAENAEVGQAAVAKGFAVADRAAVGRAVADQAVADSAVGLRVAGSQVVEAPAADLQAVVFGVVHQEAPVDSRPPICFVDSTRTATA